MTDSTEHHGHGDPDPEILVGPIAKSVVALIVTTVVFAVLMIPLVNGFDEVVEARVEDRDTIEIARPTGPLLQPSPEGQMEVFRAHEKKVVESYGWTDQASGVARLPIDRAKELVLADGLGPVVAEEAEEATP